MPTATKTATEIITEYGVNVQDVERYLTLALIQNISGEIRNYMETEAPLGEDTKEIFLEDLKAAIYNHVEHNLLVAFPKN